jgi:hypothetical protein
MENQTTATGPATTETNTKVAGVNVHDTQSHRTHAYDALAAAKADIARGKAEAESAQAAQTTEGSQAEATGQTDTSSVSSSLLEANVESELLNSSHKGVNWNDTVAGLPEDAQKLIGNLRADYTKKTQELAAQRKALESERQALLNSDFTKTLDETLAKDTGEFDPFSNESVQNRIEQEVAMRMKAMLEPLQTEYELQQRQMSLQNFKDQHPDLTTYKTDIAKLLIEDNSLSLERAYYIVKGKAKTEEASRASEELASYKQAAREYGLKVGGGRQVTMQKRIPENVKAKGAYAVYQWVAAQKANK